MAKDEIVKTVELDREFVAEFKQQCRAASFKHDTLMALISHLMHQDADEREERWNEVAKAAGYPGGMRELDIEGLSLSISYARSVVEILKGP